MEYSTSASFTSSANGTGSQISVVPGQDLYIRTKATASAFASPAFLLDVPVRPAAPSVTINYAQEKTAESVASTIEFSLNAAMTSPVSGTNSALTLTPGSDLYLRYKATASAFASSIKHLIVPDRPASPSFTIDFVNEKTFESAGSAIEYSSNENFASALPGTGSPIQLIPGNNLYFRVKNTSSSFCSPGFLLEVPQRPSLEYTGEDTISTALFTVKAILDETMTGFDLVDLSVTNGQAQNLRGENLFDIVPAAKGDVEVSVLPNSFDNGGFASNKIATYYDNTLTADPQVDENSFMIHPNPSKNGIIYIRARQINAFAIDVYSIDGRLIKSFEEREAISRLLDLQDLQKGMYFLTINAKDKVSIHKVILE
jgi:hypothetical protein